MRNLIKLDEVLKNFNITTEISEYGNGHINDTYLVNPNRYILQKINTDIFNDPQQLMDNIESVTEFLRKEIAKSGGNPDREALTVVKTTDGKNYYKADNDNFYRVYKFIENTVTIDKVDNPEDLYNAGIGFGRFQKMLSDFPAETLNEVIKDFHNTPKRLEDLKNAVLTDVKGRVKTCRDLIDNVLNNADFVSIITDEIKNGSIPLRVTHNDTKINNILFDSVTKEAVCVIDLDTVMPGSALYDFGDALRVGGSTAAEDETDLDKVDFSIDAFVNFTKGYLSEVGRFLTDKEIELLPLSVKLMIFECGIRFLTDYLNGDVYFKIHRENHNLERAKNQFKLFDCVSEKEKTLTEIVKEITVR